MTAYKDCKVDAVQPMEMDSGDEVVGSGFSIVSANNRPLCALAFATREDAEGAHAAVARSVEKAVEVTPQG
jgi:hypothetical protein